MLVIGMLILGNLKSFGIEFPDYKRLLFSQISINEGLSDNSIECIFKDRDGLIWFGTRNGLCRFDGYAIKVYRKSNQKGSISGNRILSINEDKNGFLWIGTYKDGLNRFDKTTEQFYHYGEEHSLGNRINRIKVFSDGMVWVCTNNGLAHFDQKRDSFNIYLPVSGDDHSLKSGIVSDIIETTSGEIFVASEASEIQKFIPGEKKFFSIAYRRDPNLTGNYRKRIVEDRTGILWITANDHGLCSYNPLNGASEIFKEGKGQLSSNLLMGDMAVDPEGNLWVCTEGQGINVFNPKAKTFHYLRNERDKTGTLSSDHIYTVYFDDENIVWIGTFDKGINYYNPGQYKFESFLYHPLDLDALKGLSVLSIFQDSKSRIWVGTDGAGLFIIAGDGGIKHFIYDGKNHGGGLTSNVITSINEDASGNILIGTYSGGMVSINMNTHKFTGYLPDDHTGNSLHSINIWSIFRDSKNRIWLGLLANGVDSAAAS